MEAQKTAIIYCRVSSKEQVEGTSLESQEQACKNYAQRENVTVTKVFIELGESAKTADRPEFNKAILFCSNKKTPVDFFIVHKVDRFARNQDDYAAVRVMLKRYGTEIRSATEPINETPWGRFMQGILSASAEFDNSIRSTRTTQGMLERLKQGFWVWAPPLGYYRPYQGANIVPEKETSHLIRLVFEEYSKGIYTYQGIANFISERGLKTKSGKSMTPQLMEKMLKNPLYKGYMNVWGGHEGAFVPIVSPALFAKCQPNATRSVHSSPRSANNPLFPLRKLIACEDCGVTLTGSVSKGRHGKGYPYYHHHDKNCEKKKSFPKETFEQMFIEYLDSITPGPEYEKLFKTVVLDIWKNNYKRIDDANLKLEKQITALTHERQKIFDFHMAGKYTDEDFEEQRKRINERIAERRSLMREKWEEELNIEEVLEYCFSYVRNTAAAWVKADFQTRSRLQKRVFAGNIQFDGERLGTAKLSRVYAINQSFVADKSSLVAPRGVEPLLPG